MIVDSITHERLFALLLFFVFVKHDQKGTNVLWKALLLEFLLWKEQIKNIWPNERIAYLTTYW